MKVLFAVILVVHGLIHFMGAAKAFGVAELPQLTQPISKPVGLLWLLGGLLQFLTVATLFTFPRWWWWVGAVAVIVSQAVICTSWTDAKYGTIANLILLMGVIVGFLSYGPGSFQAQFDSAVEKGLQRITTQPTLLTEADLAPLPEPVQRYLRVTGSLGQPRVQNFRLRFRGQIRSGPAARWMKFTAEQYSFQDEATRLFLMRASSFGIPFEALHMFVGPSATMRVKAASLVQVVDSKGPDMDRAETVTLFNDLCVFAPAALVDRNIRWEPVDTRSLRAFYTNAGHTVSAELFFNEAGELIDFRSDDRLQSSPDGKTFTRTRWSTPVSGYRAFGPRRVSVHGEARWHPVGGEFTYGKFELEEIEYNLTIAAAGKSI
jgi:hypothetical protein